MGNPSQKRDAPKCLGDLLEALAGALLIDCRFQDDIFFQVFTPFLHSTSVHPGETIPEGIYGVSNPIRTFLYTFSCFGIPRTSISLPIHDLLPADTLSHLTQSKCQITVRGRFVQRRLEIRERQQRDLLHLCIRIYSRRGRIGSSTCRQQQH